MRLRNLLAATLAAGALIAPATAQASESGAERAVRSEVRFDGATGSADTGSVTAWCDKRRRGYYTCEINVWSCGFLCGHNTTGRARVWQYGRRYVVTYRLYY